MANEIMKEIKTRIALKYNTYEYWTTGEGKDYAPLKGEVCFCAIESKDQGAQTAPTVLFKVGVDGIKKFSALKWASALAADVYDWAKKPESEFITWVNTIVEHPAAPIITTGNANGTIAVNGTDVAVKGLGSAAYTNADAYATSEQGTKAENAAAAIATYGDIVTHNASEFAPHNIDTGVHSVELAGGTSNGTLKLTVDGEPVDNIAVTGLQDAAYTTVNTLNATAKGYADDVQDNLTAYETAHKDDYTNTKIDELVQGAKDYADNNDANTEYHVEYDSDNKKIKLVAGADDSKMEIDATAFIKDGMIQSVELVTEDDGGNKGQFLKITWNTDGDVDADDVTYVNVTTLVDVYVGENGDYVNVTVTSDNKIKADLTEAAKTKLNKVWEEVGVAARLDAALKAELQKEIDDDIATYDAGKKFGDIITHNAAEFAGIKEDGAKALADENKLAIDAINNAETGILAQAKAYSDSLNHEDTKYAAAIDGGLKLNENNEFAIDDTVVFVLDCNW